MDGWKVGGNAGGYNTRALRESTHTERLAVFYLYLYAIWQNVCLEIVTIWIDTARASECSGRKSVRLALIGPDMVHKLYIEIAG